MTCHINIDMPSSDLLPGSLAIVVDSPAIARSWIDGPGGEKTTIVDLAVPTGEIVMVLKNFEIENDYIEAWWPTKQRWIILGKWTVVPLDDVRME